MFCPFCGAEVGKEAKFCNSCGKNLTTAEVQETLSSAKVYENVERQTLMQSISKGNHEALGVAKGNHIDSVEMVVSIEKVEGKAYSKTKASIWVDNIEIGTVPNGETATYKISSGQHCIKIGIVSAWVDIPQDIALINLSFKWGPKTKPEIVCQQQHLVTAASIDEHNIVLFYALASFFVPLAGMILYIRERKIYPKSAKAAGISAIVGCLVCAVIYIIIYNL